ncbi:MAG: hypothetical protein MJB57_11830 [Gemmatimonadetes bacterium]|nr:hypothetical protein [Gemmatimonadota bacterium]
MRATLMHEETSYVARSRYYMQLQRFRAHFDDSQILVLDADELLERRLFALRRVFEFVGVDGDLFHPKFGVLPHRTEQKRRASPFGVRLANARRTRPGRLVPGRAWRALNRVPGVSKPIEPQPDPRAVLDRDVVDLLREEANQLRALTGLDFSGWSV